MLSVVDCALHDAAGSVTALAAICRDITGHKQAELLRVRSAELELQNHRILEASRMKTEFLTHVSHELRTPLNAIIGFAELLCGGHVAPSSSKHQEFLGHVLSSSKHLLRLINDLLDLAKVEAGKIELRPEPVILPQLVSEVVDIVGAISMQKHLRISVFHDPTLVGICIDPGRFKQILYNYLSNAVKFTPDGGHVTIRTGAEGDEYFRVDVEDTGAGIAPQDIGRLFAEFQQLESGTTRRHQGTGLGLALTKRLAQAQGGSVAVHSVLGRGSVFSAVLPRRAAQADRLA
jgi:signal transduction histidine kinase